MSIPAVTGGDHTCTGSGDYANMCSVMVVCVLLNRLPSIAALGGAQAPGDDGRAGRAWRRSPGAEQCVGDVSPAAEAFGIVPRMRVGEALARCPDLRLLPPDPEATRGYWSAVLDRLEALGAAVESDDAGVAYFEAKGLERLHGGRLEGVLAAVAALAATDGPHGRGAQPVSPRLCGGGACASPQRGGDWCPRARCVHSSLRCPLRCCDRAPASRRFRRCWSDSASARSANWPAFPASAVAERFGHPGLLALELAQGRDTALEPRRPQEPLFERLTLPDAASGPQLERALEMVIARLLARRERRGRSLRAVALSARFVEGGTWRVSVPLRGRASIRSRLRLVLVPKLADLPAPAESSAWRWRHSGRPPMTRRCWSRTRAICAGHASAKPSATSARPPVRTRSCACSRWIRTHDCPSGAPCWRRFRKSAGDGRTKAWASERDQRPSGADGVPVAFGATPVDSVLEDWLVEDRWWSDRPVRRRYLGARVEAAAACRVPRPEQRPLVLAAWLSCTAHSAFSFLDGASHPVELASAAPNPATRRWR